MLSSMARPARHIPAFNRKTVASWCLYDFANSFYVVLPAVIWQVYYKREIVGNAGGRDDFWWGSIISTSMLLVALTSPMMGAIADFAGSRKRLLIAYTVTCVSAVALFGTVQPGMLLWGFALSVLANLALEGGLVFYNAYLPEIAPREYQGRISGWGFGTGYAGTAMGLFLALIFIRQKMYAETWLAIAAAFLIFAMPAFLWLPGMRLRGWGSLTRRAGACVNPGPRFRRSSSTRLCVSSCSHTFSSRMA